MSDGGGDTLREAESHSVNYRHAKKKRSGVSDFTHSIARVAVAQICDDAGFQGFQRSALDTLSDVAVQYVREIGRTANMYANLACRSHCNVFDVVQGLEDLGLVQGFTGASDVHHCLASSGVVRELLRLVGEAEEIPFAYSVPGFPVAKQRESWRSFAQAGVEAPADHIPSWLPVFPDPETYMNLHLGQEKAPCDDDEPVEKHKDADWALTSLQQKMTSNESEPSVATNVANGAKGKSLLQCNPFLASPLQHGEKVISSVAPPAKRLDEAFNKGSDNGVLDDHVSVLDTFAPAIEGVGCGRKIGSEDERKSLVSLPLNRGSSIRFTFGRGRKSYMALSSQKSVVVKTTTRFIDDEEKDEKKTRAEQILKQSYESAGAESLVN